MTIEKRYLNNWNYNGALILEELEKIVLENGGILISTWNHGPRKQYEIVNRSIMNAIREETERAERLERITGKTAERARARIAELEAIDNAPRLTAHGDYHYIGFTLNGFYYYYQLDSNPFFDFYYSKSAIENGKTNRNGYLSGDPKNWLFDCFFTWSATDEQRKTAAATIFDMLLQAQPTRRHKNGRLADLFPLTGEKC